jgi:serine/threonine protein kinase
VTACPPHARLRALLTATVSAAEAETLDSHIKTCGDCLRTLDVLSDDTSLQHWRDGSHGTLVQTSTPPSLPFLDPPQRPGDLGTLGTNRIEAVVGKGGMGIVFRGWDEALNRPVAVKVLRPELDVPQARDRFVREARAAAGLHNDHVVAVYGVFSPPEGVPYFTMEYRRAKPRNWSPRPPRASRLPTPRG